MLLSATVLLPSLQPTNFDSYVMTYIITAPLSMFSGPSLKSMVNSHNPPSVTPSYLLDKTITLVTSNFLCLYSPTQLNIYHLKPSPDPLSTGPMSLLPFAANSLKKSLCLLLQILLFFSPVSFPPIRLRLYYFIKIALTTI